MRSTSLTSFKARSTSYTTGFMGTTSNTTTIDPYFSVGNLLTGWSGCVSGAVGVPVVCPHTSAKNSADATSPEHSGGLLSSLSSELRSGSSYGC